MIVAFGYKSRSGKDTAANIFEQEMGKVKTVLRTAFATKLKRVSYDLFHRYGLRHEEYYNTPAGAAQRNQKLPGINKTPVEIWIEVGMKMREIDPDVWLNPVMDMAALREDAVLVVSDLRFPNEAKAIREAGGITIRVDRDSAITNGSDVYLNDWQFDHVIDNNGTLDDLRRSVKGIVNQINYGHM